MKKNNTTSKTIQDVEAISNALKESTKKSLHDLLNEAIANVINEDEDDETIEDEDSFNVEDVDTDEATDDDEAIESAETPENDEMEGEDDTEEPTEETEDDTTDDEDDFDEFDEFKVGDNDYDFTGVDDDKAFEIYSKLGDDDKIFVKPEGDGKYTVEDEETGAEYVIDLNVDDDSESEDMADDEASEDGNDAELEIDLSDNDEDEVADENDADEDTDIPAEDEDAELEIELSGDDEDDDTDEDETLNENNIMDNNYQDKTAMTLPSDDNSGDSRFDDGAPKGGANNSKNFGKSKGNPKPFDSKVNECGDNNMAEEMIDESDTISTTDVRHNKKTKVGQHRPNAPEYATRKQDSGSNERLEEAFKKIYAKAKQIQNENKQYEKDIQSIKKALMEAAVLNVSLSQVVKLLSENTTTAAEKKGIVERFNNVKTISESKSLYDTIKRELNENRKPNSVMLEHQISATPSKTLNETVIYNSGNNPVLSLMERMDNLYK